ncbi:hypothetical protein BJ508DRAFT_310116 [Ascobolus immersus RN42]|uniref:Uncharacterized protein n=1 Tax=Ascobolus immersus RN42 TaxID=1160509 RepID=A0A3N4HUM4_ASCIM|nr:hypothetical protein BJ508DRAFT_310116 [Ascobolus immersus RN42]
MAENAQSEASGTGATRKTFAQVFNEINVHLNDHATERQEIGFKLDRISELLDNIDEARKVIYAIYKTDTDGYKQDVRDLKKTLGVHWEATVRALLETALFRVYPAKPDVTFGEHRKSLFKTPGALKSVATALGVPVPVVKVLYDKNLHDEINEVVHEFPWDDENYVLLADSSIDQFKTTVWYDGKDVPAGPYIRKILRKFAPKAQVWEHGRQTEKDRRTKDPEIDKQNLIIQGYQGQIRTLKEEITASEEKMKQTTRNIDTIRNRAVRYNERVELLSGEKDVTIEELQKQLKNKDVGNTDLRRANRAYRNDIERLRQVNSEQADALAAAVKRLEDSWGDWVMRKIL